MKNVIFIGMPASGKSTIGVVVAKRLGYDFIDTDLLIQKQEGKLLKDIIEEVGSDGFLRIENRVNRELQAERSVIAPGGSVIYCREAMEHFQELGTIVYLKVPYETIYSRISDVKNRGVVLKENQTFREMYAERTALFEQYADYIVDEEGLSLNETIDEVLLHLQNESLVV